jgi:hypothetical protein
MLLCIELVQELLHYCLQIQRLAALPGGLVCFFAEFGSRLTTRTSEDLPCPLFRFLVAAIMMKYQSQYFDTTLSLSDMQE